MDISKTLRAVVLLDNDGKQNLARYFDGKLATKQFERKVFVRTKMNRTKEEILVVDNLLIMHKFVCDNHIYVIGNRGENPMVLDALLNCLVDVVTALMSKGSERQSAKNNRLSQLILALDEICDEGLILEVDSNLVLQRVLLKDEVVEQSMAQKIQSATEHIRFPWIRS